MGEFTNPPAIYRPVVINNDGGGLVDNYEAAVNRYTVEGREVRIKGSCRSACILSLAVPNVCVYPSAVVKAHNAYEQNTGLRRPDVTARMLSWLPTKIQSRLRGRITDSYNTQTVLSGSELISLGVRRCDGSKDKTVVAKDKASTCAWAFPWLIKCLLK
jgi:hypothetical protein